MNKYVLIAIASILTLVALSTVVPFLPIVLAGAVIYAIYNDRQPEDNLKEFLHRKKQYLFSKEWKEKRLQTMKRDNFKCQHCGASGAFHIHHTSGYMLIPYEPISCLLTLCPSCHKKEHEKKGYPKSLKDYKNWGTKRTYTS